MHGANIELVTQSGGISKGGGLVAQRLLQSGFNVNALRTNDTLRKDEWKLYDTAIVGIAKARLNGVADLMAAGLSYKLPNALGVTRLEWETDTDMTPASIGMSGIQRGQDDRQEFALQGMPIPVIFKDWSLNIRQLEASRKTGLPLDVTMAQKAGRSVAECIESVLWNGYTGLGSNNPIYGYTTAVSRNTGTLGVNWSTGSGDTLGGLIIKDVLAMIGKAQADHMYGPYMIYTSIAAGTNLGNDFKLNGDKSIRQRVLEIEGISGIKATASLADNQILLVQMTADVVQMIDGIQPTMVQWDSHGGMVTNFKVLAIMLPRFRNDSEGQSGLVHYSI